MLNITPMSVVLFVQAVLLAVSQLDFVTLTAQRIIIIALIVVNAALVYLFTSAKPAIMIVKAQVLGNK